MFCLKTAFGGGKVAPPWRCSDSWVAKFSGQTSHGTIKVTQIFALSGHSIGLALLMFLPHFVISLVLRRFSAKTLPNSIRSQMIFALRYERTIDRLYAA